MKQKISLAGLEKVLSPREMRNVVGGSGDGQCCYSPNFNGSPSYSCTDAATCSAKAGPSGWWCCSQVGNCPC